MNYYHQMNFDKRRQLKYKEQQLVKTSFHLHMNITLNNLLELYKLNVCRILAKNRA